MKAYLRIIESDLLPTGELSIKKMGVFDPESQELIRIAKITPELQKCLHSMEIDTDLVIKVNKQIQKNESMRFLIDTFDLKLI